MTNPTQTAPPSAPAAPTPPKAAVAISRELADFLLELSITLNKHAIYPSKHPLLDLAIYGVANRLALLFNENRDSLSIGVARRQLIIEGVATDPYNPVLKELAQRLHKHHVGALKFVRGISREELADVLAALALDPIRTEKPIGHDLERVGDLWEHVRFFPLTYDRLQLIEDDGSGEAPGPDQMAAGRATQLWIGLARAALVSDTSGASSPQRDEADDNTALEPATVARAIDEHQREEAYDQVIVGYLLQIGEELRTADGPEAVGLQRRVSRLVGSLKESTLGKLLEMGGDKAQRRKFLLDASQGITVEAVIDLVKAASAAEGQTVSHSMLRMLSKLAHHPSTGGQRQRTDPTIRDVMRRLVDDWSLDDPNPEAYRKVLENMSSSRSIGSAAANAVPTECEPERMVQIAIEVGAMGPQVRSAMSTLCNSGRASILLDLVERAPDADAGAPVWEFLLGERILDTLLSQQRMDFPLIGRFARRIGIPAVAPLLAATKVYEDAKMRAQFYDLLESLGDGVGPAVADAIVGAAPLVQRELIALLGRLSTVPPNFSPAQHLVNPEPLVRREVVRLLLRDPSARNEAAMAALTDQDDRVVFVGLTAAQEKSPPGAIDLIKQRVDRGELDSQLRTMGIRLVAQQKSQEVLDWLLGFVVSETRWSRRAKLRPSTPEMLAALSVLALGWGDDPAVASVLGLAEQSKDAEVRAKVARKRSIETKGNGPA
ncbi:MAG TPA: hypothetical protein VHT23_05925 [Gemmatimonadaceae bacterium]|nr:hypothetical protein [Gemmatimonadaceae bacterium]